MPPIPARLPRAAAFFLLCGCCATIARAQATPIYHPASSRRASASSAFEHAERLRDKLEARPRRERDRAGYERVLAEYRGIYRYPGDPYASAALDAAAGLLAEEGRDFNDRTLLRAAVDDYAYLRRKYPASRFRQRALLAEAEIEASDLHERAQAQTAFTEFLKEYPYSTSAAEARQQLRVLERVSTPPNAAAAEDRGRASADPDRATRTEQARRNAAEHAQELAELNATGAWRPTQPAADRRASGTSQSASAGPDDPAHPVHAPTSAATSSNAVITGIRHWSTPIYTRVAIDLSGEVQYEAARVPNPDRIYFDLHGARLAAALLRTPVNVTDEGYLRRVSAAAYAGGTRIVLDVSHVSQYSAFFLPNPWRLIIDIHSAAANGAVLYGSTARSADGTPAPASVPAAGGPAKASPATQQEVAALSQTPTRVKATHHPTTGPIAASVAGTKSAAQPNELEDLGASAGSANTGRTTQLAWAAPQAPDTPTSASAPFKRSRHKPAANAGLGSPQKHGTQVAANSPPSAPIASNLAPEVPAASAREAAPTSTGERSLVRTLGLKIGRIVIDAGHGGHDSGTLGPEGIEEKDVVLDVSLRLGNLLKQRLGADVIYTRSDDTFIPLETRTAIANKAQADLFISVHANSSSDPSARGVEVYYLNFTTSPEALEVAARENAVSNQSIYQLSDLVKKIALKDKIDESHEFASDVESSLYSGLEAGNPGLKDRGVKKAPFVVLIGANMPSILAEISFLTNPDDARQLRDPAYRQRIAESLYRGVARYVNGLSGVRVAQEVTRPSGQ